MDQSSSIEVARQLLLGIGIVLAAGTLCGFLSQKLKVPDVALLLVAGMAIGPAGLGLIHVAVDSTPNQIILIFGSCYILFDGGASMRFKVLREVWITVTALSTAGVIVTAVITGVAAHYILGLPMAAALLLGAAIAPTDPATLVPVFRQLRVRDRVAQTVISESAFTDATGAVLTFAVLAWATGNGEYSWTSSLEALAWQSAAGIAGGALLGYLAAILIAHENHNYFSDYAPVVSLMAVIAAYIGANELQASGFMAVFVFGIVLGNKDAFGFHMRAGEAAKLDDFVVTTALLMRVFIFVLLGSQVDFTLMSRYLAGSVLVVAVLMLIARPATVFVCTLPDRRARWHRNEMLFMCWTRETGVIPGALAGLLVGMKAPGAQVIAAVTFVAILVTILIQATTTRWLAAKLELLEDGEA